VSDEELKENLHRIYEIAGLNDDDKDHTKR
jgi:hypothetical protein